MKKLTISIVEEFWESQGQHLHLVAEELLFSYYMVEIERSSMTEEKGYDFIEAFYKVDMDGFVVASAYDSHVAYTTGLKDKVYDLMYDREPEQEPLKEIKAGASELCSNWHNFKENLLKAFAVRFPTGRQVEEDEYDFLLEVSKAGFYSMNTVEVPDEDIVRFRFWLEDNDINNSVMVPVSKFFIKERISALPKLLKQEVLRKI